MNDPDNFEGEELDIEPFEGPPYWVSPVCDTDGYQDDEAGLLPKDIVSFVGAVAPHPNTWRETLDWYRYHDTAAAIGFDPDGMCLKICRTARNIPSKFLTAKQAQEATPPSHRITRVRDLRRGMVLFFDDPRDDNRAGHIVTMLGRVRDFDAESLHDVLVITNSVEQNQLTIVRGDYFEQHWGDDFQFGATYLNGVELDIPNHGTKVERFHDTAPTYDLSILRRAGKDRPAPAMILDRIITQVRRLPDSPKLVQVQHFKELVKDHDVLDLRILDSAVHAGRVGLVKSVRDEIRRLIDRLPEE